MDSGVFFTTYEADMALRRKPLEKLRLGLFIAFVLVFPFVAGTYPTFLMNQIGIATIGALGLNLLVGYTGQISLGQGAFLAVGAYTAGILTAKLGVPWYLTLVIAPLFTALVGAVFGIPSLRLKGLYLAIATLAAQEIIIWVVTHWDSVTGGVHALVVPPPTLFGMPLNRDFRFYWIIWACVGFTALTMANLLRTHYGRAFVAIRDHDIAAEIMGIDLFKYKLLAFGLSSFYVGLAGALLAHWRSIVTWERFTIEVSVLYLAMIIIGGLGSIAGSLYGAAFMTLLPAVLNNLGMAFKDTLPWLEEAIPYIQQASFGLIIILFLILEPRGLNKLWQDVKNYFKLWPFSY